MALLLAVVQYGLYFDLPLVVLVLIYVFWITPNYYFEIVEHRALGNAGWPVFSIETLVAGRSQVGVVFTLLVLLAAAGYFALRWFGEDTAAWWLLGVGLVLLPGSVALLAVTRRFSAALNPARVLAGSLGMGSGYLFCLAAGVAIVVLLGLARERGLLWYLPLTYGLLLHAFLVGNVVYARRNVLGVYTSRSPEAQADRAQSAIIAIRKGVLNHAYGFAMHGNRAGAIRHIESYVTAEDDSLEARLWFLHESARWESSHAALELGQRIIDYCEHHEHQAEAARLRRYCEQLKARH